MNRAPPLPRAGASAPLASARGAELSPAPRGSLLAFFLLTYALSWACFLPVAAAVPARSPLGAGLILLGAYAPSLAALVLSSRGGGTAGVSSLLSRVVQWRVRGRWYVFAAGYFIAIKLAVALVHRLGTGGWPRFGGDSWFLIPAAILFSTPFQAGEEIGWRGYALPRMAARWGLAPSSLLLGLIWALWHLPLFFVRDADTYGQSFPVYVLQVTAISVAMAWLWERGDGSLLPPMLLHAAINNSKDIVPSGSPVAGDPFGWNASLVAWLTAAALWACAAFFLARMPRPPGQSGGERAT